VRAQHGERHAQHLTADLAAEFLEQPLLQGDRLLFPLLLRLGNKTGNLSSPAAACRPKHRNRTSPVFVGFWLSGGGRVQPHCLVAGSKSHHFWPLHWNTSMPGVISATWGTARGLSPWSVVTGARQRGCSLWVQAQAWGLPVVVVHGAGSLSQRTNRYRHIRCSCFPFARQHFSMR
jgi:hypothetical protein